MTPWERLQKRLSRARQLGWKLEDSGITPGLPLFGIRRPDGEIAGVIGYMHDPRHVEGAMKRLDELGVPA